jgi:hypothetical protein
MRSLFTTTASGIQIGLSTRKNLLSFIVLSILFFVAMFSIPVINIPGNSILFQAELYHLDEYLILIALSFMSGLSLWLQWVAFRTRKKGAAQEAVLGGTGILSGVVSSLFASASCATCIGALFSFLGFNTILFLAVHRWYILAFAFTLLVISIYLAARKIAKGCEVCLV